MGAQNSLTIDWFHFKSCNEVCMRLSKYFGIEVWYSTLKMKEHVFQRLADFSFFRNGEVLKTTLQFHKNCQNIFQNVFYQMWWGIFRSIEWSEKNIKVFKIKKMAAVFLKILKMYFLEKVNLNIFFCWVSILWATYFPSLASGKQFIPIEKKNIFRKTIKIVNFSRNYRRKE